MSARLLLAVGCGAIIGAGLVVACSDDSPAAADAAEACDCPAAERPIQGRTMLVESSIIIEGGSGATDGASCPEGATLLSGGCALLDPGQGFLLVQSMPSQSLSGWTCEWRDTNTTGSNTGLTRAICLIPAAQ